MLPAQKKEEHKKSTELFNELQVIEKSVEQLINESAVSEISEEKIADFQNTIQVSLLQNRIDYLKTEGFKNARQQQLNQLKAMLVNMSSNIALKKEARLKILEETSETVSIDFPETASCSSYSSDENTEALDPLAVFKESEKTDEQKMLDIEDSAIWEKAWQENYLNAFTNNQKNDISKEEKLNKMRVLIDLVYRQTLKNQIALQMVNNRKRTASLLNNTETQKVDGNLEETSLIQWGEVLKRASAILNEIVKALPESDFTKVRLLNDRVVGHLFTVTTLIETLADPHKAEQIMLARYGISDNAQVNSISSENEKKESPNQYGSLFHSSGVPAPLVASNKRNPDTTVSISYTGI